MNITDEDIAAFADGELTGDDEARVAQAAQQEPAIAAKVAAHRQLREQLSAHFAPILDQELPERLTRPLTPQSEVVDFAAAKEKRQDRKTLPRQGLPRWSWIAGPALAASLVLAVVTTGGGGSDISGDYAGSQLAQTLDSQLVASQSAGAETRILVSFRNEADQYCRAFAGGEASGIACREEQGWKMVAVLDGSEASTSEYRQAGSSDAALFAMVQDMAQNGALGREEEVQAKANGWR